MATSTPPARPAAAPSAAPTPRPGLGIVAMLTGATGNQTGAALAARAFPALGPLGVVAVRQFVAAAVLLPLARPRLRQLSWAQWWPCLLLGAVFATMNISLYSAIDIGLAVTLEFLGPLAVALVGSRSLRDLALALLAAAGVYVLVLPSPSTDLLGIALALTAASCWAAYILINRLAGTRLPGLQAAAIGSLTSATLYLPVAITLIIGGSLHGEPLLLAAAAGVLSSAVPYASDLTALRYIPPRFFGVFMSINPILAAIAGLIILQQHLTTHEWIGIAIIVVANIVVTAGQAATPTPKPHRDTSAWRKRRSLNGPLASERRHSRPAAHLQDQRTHFDCGSSVGARNPSAEGTLAGHGTSSRGRSR